MKATDLMIGDWVSCDGKNYQIAEIGGMVCLDAENELFASLEDITPILLTKEILLKNGWCEESDYENDLYGGHFPEDKECRLELDIDECEVWWTINCVEYYIIPLHYVHDLQHALKLCGIDKEIVL